MKPSMFMRIDLIEGESKDEDHTSWIDVLSWSWGATINVHLSGGGRSLGQGQVTSFDFTKYIDKASPALAHATVIGKHISEAEFHATKAGDQGQALVYVKFQFHDVIIKSYKTGGGSDSEDLPVEHVSLDYERMKYQYVEQDLSGSSLSKPEMFWDAMQGKGSIS